MSAAGAWDAPCLMRWFPDQKRARLTETENRRTVGMEQIPCRFYLETQRSDSIEKRGKQ
jgi:hypothetical protein